MQQEHHRHGTQRTLVVLDGDLGGLVNLTRVVLARDSSQAAGQVPSVVYGLVSPAISDECERAASAQMDRLGVQPALSIDDSKRLALAELLKGESIDRSRELVMLHARWIAEDMDCDRVLWYEHAGSSAPDQQPVASVSHHHAVLLNTRLLISQLGLVQVPQEQAVRASVSAVRAISRRQPATIDCPLMDLDDSILASLALDLDCPVDLVWWAMSSSDKGTAARVRWSEAGLIMSYN